VEAQRAAREEAVEEEEGAPEDESLPPRGERHAPTRIGVGAKLKTQYKNKNPNSLVHLRARHKRDAHIAFG
jgi:hypothetical protein